MGACGSPPHSTPSPCTACALLHAAAVPCHAYTYEVYLGQAQPNPRQTLHAIPQNAKHEDCLPVHFTERLGKHGMFAKQLPTNNFSRNLFANLGTEGLISRPSLIDRYRNCRVIATR